MSRLSYVDCTRLSPEQKELYDSIAGGPRAAKRPSLLDAQGHITGPFNAFLHYPALGKHWSAIGEGLRFKTKLAKRLFELSILVIAVQWRASHEWAAHAHLARAEGVSDDVIAALRRGERPRFEKRDEETVYAFVHALVSEHHVNQSVYDALFALLGEEQTIELVNACGYYIALAVMLKAFDVHPPSGLDDPW
ncbi:MAG TPA: carboxymuconolactone decarboxylase family protein [Micropepsaceae bacterium]|nr:carboxymuconolactone decarboxylase family protein [Micropepsaceae bacterium]